MEGMGVRRGERMVTDKHEDKNGDKHINMYVSTKSEREIKFLKWRKKRGGANDPFSKHL